MCGCLLGLHKLYIVFRGVARNLLQGDKRVDLGAEVPQRGPGVEPRWGLAAKLPVAGDKC